MTQAAPLSTAAHGGHLRVGAIGVHARPAHPLALEAIPSPTHRTLAADMGSIGIDAIHARTQAAASIIGLTLVHVPAADAVAREAGGAGGTGEAARQIDALGGAGRVGSRRLVALVHIHATDGRHSIGLPARIAEATIAGVIRAGDTGTMATEFPGTGLGAVRPPLGAVHAMPALLAQAGVGPELILALGSILAAQVCALVQGALIDVHLALGALERMGRNGLRIKSDQ